MDAITNKAFEENEYRKHNTQKKSPAKNISWKKNP